MMHAMVHRSVNIRTMGNLFLSFIPMYSIENTACPLKQNEYKLMVLGKPAQCTSLPLSWNPTPSHTSTHRTAAMRMH